MRGQRLMFAFVAAALAGSVTFAQPGRGGSQWLTALADAQRTSWVRADDKISVASLSKPGFELQWKSKLDNQPRGAHGLAQGVTASGVTLFVPMSVVAGSSNNVYGIDNDLGYVVWRRHFDAALPAATAACAGGITVRGDAHRQAAIRRRLPPSAGFGGGRGRGVVGYRSLLGEPGEGVPVEGRAAGPARGGDPPRRAAGRAPPGVEQGARGAAPPAALSAANQTVDRIPGAPRAEEGSSPFGFLFRPSGVGYVVSSDGMLHVLGLAVRQGHPAAGAVPAREREVVRARSPWARRSTRRRRGSAAAHRTACGRSISTATPSRSCRGRPTAGRVVGAVAFTPDGTLIAAIGPGPATGDGKANAIVALDPKTLQLKDWFTQPTAEFVTGPTILRHNDKELVVGGDEGRTRAAARRGIARRRESRDAARGVEAVPRRRRRRRRGRAGGLAGADRHVVDPASRLGDGSPRGIATATNGPVAAAPWSR